MEKTLADLRLTLLRLGYLMVDIEKTAVLEYNLDTPQARLERLGPRSDEHREYLVTSAIKELISVLPEFVDVNKAKAFALERGDMERLSVKLAVINYNEYLTAAT